MMTELERLEPILRAYDNWIMTKDYDMDGDCPDESLETEADAIAALIARTQEPSA